MAVPRWWEYKPGDDNAIAVMYLSPVKGKDDRFRENITVTSADLLLPEVVEMFWENNKKAVMMTLPGYKSQLSEGEYFSGMNKGRYLMFKVEDDKIALRVKTVVWIKGTVVYSATCTAEEKDYAKYSYYFEKMFASFRFNPPKPKIRLKKQAVSK